MFGVTFPAARAAEAAVPGPSVRGPLPAPCPAPFPRRSSAAPAPCPHRVARWAWGEGLRAGDAVALMVGDLGQSEALRLGLARIGVRARCLDAAARGRALAEALAASGAVLAIVDTALAGAYAGVMGLLSDDPAAYPALWWNGPGADFARLDLALAELG